MSEAQKYKTRKDVRMPSARDYSRIEDVKEGIERLIAGLKEDNDDYRMFELMGKTLQSNPDLLMEVIVGSVVEAERRLGQDRRIGSSASLFYPVDAAIRVIAKQKSVVEKDPLSASNWTEEDIVKMIEMYPRQIIELAGSNTTSKNLPQRAAHILWLIDQVDQIKTGQPLSFVEIGASGGLVLDGLRNPMKFVNWMKSRRYRSDYGNKIASGDSFATIGIDLVRPSMDWLEALILDDDLRRETQNFIQKFPRSEVLEADARHINNLPLVDEVIRSNSESIPFVFSCFVFYQLPNEVREEVIQNTRSFLNKFGGGFMLISDIAKYMGYPEKAGGSIAWIEDSNGQIVSPKIFASRPTLTEWRTI